MLDGHNFAAAWHASTQRCDAHRGSAAEDLAYWQENAVNYDERSTAPGHFEQTLAALQGLVRADDTLLDVGAGTGRFALPLAASVRRVTALDHAAPMLDVLRRKMAEQALTNVHTVHAAWENADITPHDVVLAAWSLYRQPDILAAMRKLINATRRTLIIVASAGNTTRHNSHLAAIWGDNEAQRTPLHLYFYGALWQVGVHPDLRIIRERHLLQGDSPSAIAAQIAPRDTTAEALERLATRLLPFLQQVNGIWTYEHFNAVGMVVWHRP